jgi:hypothetical protein
VRILLDEMFSPAIAARLRERGHDVEAVLERSQLMGQSDGAIFATAQVEGRAIVTENVPDFRRIAKLEAQLGRTHSGLIFTTDHRFPRRDKRTLGRLITALDGLLCSGIDSTNLEHWLA